MRTAFVLVCALVFGVGGVTTDAYEVIIENGVVVTPRVWSATATTPALGALSSTTLTNDGDNNAVSLNAIPGEVTLAQGGALRVTRTSWNTGDSFSAPENSETRVVVVVLGASELESMEVSQPTHLAIDVFAVYSGDIDVSPTRVTTCTMRLDENTLVWRVAEANDETDFVSCTAAETLPENNTDASLTAPPTMTRVEIVLPATYLYSSIPRPLFVTGVDLRVESDSSEDENSNSEISSRPLRFIARGVALASRSDLVELAWSWLARATKCASSVRQEVILKCGEDEESETESSWQLLSNLFLNVDVEKLLNGCCDAIETYTDASCSCALQIVNGTNMFADSTISRGMHDAETMDTAVRSLDALCFGGANDEASSCLASSATLKATRGVILERKGESSESSMGSDVYDSVLDRDILTVYKPATEVRAQAGVSPTDEYAAFLNWLDGDGDNEMRSDSDGIGNALSVASSSTTASLESSDDQNASRLNAQSKATNAKDSIKSGLFYDVVFSVSAFAVACLIGLVAVLNKKRLRKKRSAESTDDFFLDADGDVIRLVARRRQEEGAGNVR